MLKPYTLNALAHQEGRPLALTIRYWADPAELHIQSVSIWCGTLAIDATESLSGIALPMARQDYAQRRMEGMAP